MNSPDTPSSMVTYWRLLSYVRPYWKLFLLSIIGFALYASTQPALAQLIEYLIDAINEKDYDARYWLPIVVIIIYIVRGIGSFMGSVFLAKVSQNVVHNLRSELFAHQLKLPASFFEQENSGHLIARITYNVNQVTGAATGAIKVIIREGLTVMGLLGYLLYMNWKLTLIFFVIGPLIGGVVRYAGKRFKKISKRIQVSVGDITHVTSEAIHAHKEVRIFGGSEYEKGRFVEASLNNQRQALKLVMTSAIHTPVLQLIVAMALSVLMFIALSPDVMNVMSTGGFIAFLTAAGLMPKPIRQLSEVYVTVQKGLAAAESIFELMDAPAELNEGQLKPDSVEGKLSIRDLSFSYPGHEETILHNINLEIEAGQVVALVGHSGSGKSTLAALIPRFYNYEQGCILLDDEPLLDYDLVNLRSHIALVSQQTTLFNDTVRRNIAYGMMSSASYDQVVEAARKAHAMEFIEKLPDGLDTLIGEDGVLLSGGQRQRLAIARAILKSTPVLILDEATSALDTRSERHIQAALEEVMKGRTTLVIAHRLSTIEGADKIVVLDQGRIVEGGTHEELIKQDGAYSELHRLQFKDGSVSS